MHCVTSLAVTSGELGKYGHDIVGVVTARYTICGGSPGSVYGTNYQTKFVIPGDKWSCDCYMRKCSNTCVSQGSVEVRYTLLISGYTRRCSTY